MNTDTKETETKQCTIPSVSDSVFDMETNFITCKCEGEIDLYPPNLGDGGYDWCKKCKCSLGDDF